MALAEDYFDLVRKQCAGMLAVYPPNQSVSLGDYGTIDGGRFTRVGNAKTFAPNLVMRHESRVNMSREFTSKSTTRVALGANATISPGVVTLKPALELDFGSDFSVYFAVAGCTVVDTEALEDLKTVIVDRYRNNMWDKDWKLVTTVVEASNMTVAISQQKNSKLVLECEGDVPHVDMASASLSLHVTFDSSSSEKWVTEKPQDAGALLTPFCWAQHVTTKIFGNNPTVDPFAARIHVGPDDPARPGPAPQPACSVQAFAGRPDLSQWRSRRSAS